MKYIAMKRIADSLVWRLAGCVVQTAGCVVQTIG